VVTSWNELSARRKRVIAVTVPLQVVSAALAWRDLGRRTTSEVRGPVRFWRVLIVLNPGNSLIYWLFGRRRRA
jgi:hypothetical protein